MASVEKYVSDNEREEVHKLVAAIIAKGGSDGVSRGVVIDKLPKRFGRAMRDEILDDLIETGRVRVVEDTPPNGGRKKIRLHWRG